jgi:hypothetical protein
MKQVCYLLQGNGLQAAPAAPAATAWRGDYSMPSGPLTGMGQRSASASNLAAMNSLSADWFSQEQRARPAACHPC